MSDEKGYLFLVADGLGGAAAGERASALAAGWIEGNILEIVKFFFRFGERDSTEQNREIRASLERIDHLILSEAEADRSLAGMGTTLTLAFSVGTDLTIIHVGDSRAYLFHDGDLEQITHDHTMAQMMADAGMMRPEDVKQSKRRNIVTNVLGGPGPGVNGEIHRLHLDDGDRLLLCTDGLTDPLDDPTITRILGQHTEPDAAAHALVEAALDAGGPDNVTVVLASFAVER
jgi:protein phosphatase